MAHAKKRSEHTPATGGIIAGLERIQEALLRVRHGDASPADVHIAARVCDVLNAGGMGGAPVARFAAGFS